MNILHETYKQRIMYSFLSLLFFVELSVDDKKKKKKSTSAFQFIGLLHNFNTGTYLSEKILE